MTAPPPGAGPLALDHVGLIVRDSAGKARIMHASATYKKVVLDNTLSAYLNAFKSHAVFPDFPD